MRGFREVREIREVKDERVRPNPSLLEEAEMIMKRKKADEIFDSLFADDYEVPETK